MKKSKVAKTIKRTPVYVLWYKTREGQGWPTMNTKRNRFKSKPAAERALVKHNRVWPEDKPEMRIRTFWS